jgi:hypothetical protein
MEDPKKSDAQLLLGHYFEDAFGGVDKKYVIAIDKRDVSVWKKGANVLHAQPAEAKPAPSKISTLTQAIAKPAAANVKQPQIGETRRSRVGGALGIFVLPIEKLLIRCTVAKRKFEKYKKDRNSFFQDSKDNLAIRWYSFTNPEV